MNSPQDGDRAQQPKRIATPQNSFTQGNNIGTGRVMKADEPQTTFRLGVGEAASSVFAARDREEKVYLVGLAMALQVNVTGWEEKPVAVIRAMLIKEAQRIVSDATQTEPARTETPPEPQERKKGKRQ